MYKVLEIKELHYADIGITQIQSHIITTLFETFNEANEYFYQRKLIYSKLILLTFIDNENNETVLKKIEN